MTLYTTSLLESPTATPVDTTAISHLPPPSEKLAFAVPLLGVAVVIGFVGLWAIAYLGAKTTKERKDVLRDMSLKLQSIPGWQGDECKFVTDAVTKFFQEQLSSFNYSREALLTIVASKIKDIFFSREFKEAAQRSATPLVKYSATPQPPATVHPFKTSVAPSTQTHAVPPRPAQPVPPTVLAQVLKTAPQSFANAAGFVRAKTAFQKVLAAHPQLPADYRKKLAWYLALPYFKTLDAQLTKQVKMLEKLPQIQNAKPYLAMQATLKAMQGVETWLKEQGAPGVFGLSVAQRQKELQEYFQRLTAKTPPEKKPTRQLHSTSQKNHAAAPPPKSGPPSPNKELRVFSPPDPTYKEENEKAQKALQRWLEAQRKISKNIDAKDYAPKSPIARLIFDGFLAKQNSRPGGGISGRNTPADVSMVQINEKRQNLDKKTNDLINQYLKNPKEIHAKALIQQLGLGKTTPQQWISNWEGLSLNARVLALIALANRAMDLAIGQINKAETFLALTQDVQAHAKNPHYSEWVDAKDESPYLQAIANAFLRLGRQQGWSSGLQLAGQAAHPSRGWHPEYSEELADIVLRLNKQLLLQFPSEVLEHLKTQVVYRRGLQIYNQRIEQQQNAPLEQTIVPENLGRAVQLLRLVISEKSQPTGKVLPDLTAKSPQNVLKTGMHPKLLTSIIPDIHGNPDLLLAALDVIGEQIAATKSVPGRAVNEEEYQIVYMGDYLNKGAAPAQVLAIMRLLKAYSNGKFIKIPSWLAAKGFAKILQKLGRFKMVMLRGNHEELSNYGMHLNAKADISKYAKLGSAVMDKGFQYTVISFLQLYPELLSAQERNSMQAFINDPPILNKDGKWRTKNSSTEIEEGEAHKQYQEFRRIWLALLEKTGDLSLLEDLLPFYIDNNILYVHGGPPENLDGLEALMAYKRDGTPLPPEVAGQILWRRLPTEPRGPAAWANVITAKVIKDNLAQGDKQNSVPIASLPINVFTGHTMGSVLGQYWLSLPNGIQQLMTIVGADGGFGLQNLPIYRIEPDGDLTADRVYRTGAGIQTESVNLNGGQSKPGTQVELPNRF